MMGIAFGLLVSSSPPTLLVVSVCFGLRSFITIFLAMRAGSSETIRVQFDAAIAALRPIWRIAPLKITDELRDGMAMLKNQPDVIRHGLTMLPHLANDNAPELHP